MAPASAVALANRRQSLMSIIVQPERAKSGSDAVRAMTAADNGPARFVTFGSVAVGRDNNLNLLRMIAATAVLFSHSYALTGHIGDEPLMAASRWTDFARFGVIVFFGISGFLIAQSLTRNPSLYAFAVNRALRIVPGLVVASVFCVLAGWAATTLSSADYWGTPGTWRFLLGTPVLLMRTTLPGVFATNPYPHAVNGSLWTIPLEVWCYLAAAVVAALRILGSRWVFTALALSVVITFAYFPTSVLSVVPYEDILIAPRLAGTFLLGAWVYVNRDLIPVSVGLAACLIAAFFALASTPYGAYAFYAAITYTALVFAYHPRLQLRAYLKLGDYSYGTYVLAFPVQQLIVWRFGITEPLTLFAIALAVTVGLATLSWHFVEAPALAHKRRWGEWRPRLAPRRRVDAGS
jgi:peptidoglycan/LPS O-acetylase OafA/YrhL